MKKLFVLMFVFFFCISFTSAFEFDNTKSYNELNKEVTITNAFGLGDEIAKIKLNTPLNNRVPLGYQKVAEFEVSAFQDYNNALKELELFNKRDKDKKFVRNFDYKVRSYEMIIVNDYESSCTNLNDPDYHNRECEQILIGTHEEQREVWTKLTPSDFKKNDVLTVGIFTEVKEGDVVEWIPNIFGVRVEEWAIWTADLNVGLTTVYSFDERISASATNENVLGLINLSCNTDGWITDGIVNNATALNSSNECTTPATASNQWNVGTDKDISWNFWIKWNDITGNQWIIYNSQPATTDGWVFGNENSATIRLWYPVTNTWYTLNGANLANDIWYMVTATYNEAGTELKGYINGNNTANFSVDLSFTDTGSYLKRFGSDQGSTLDFKGYLDEYLKYNRTLSQAEITSIYNANLDGNGYTTEFNPVVSVTYPVDNTIYNSVVTELNYTIIAPNPLETCWYSLDSGLTNTTITCGNNITGLSSQPGNNTWTVYANDTDGLEGSDSVTFTFNASIGTDINFPVDGSNFTGALNISWNSTSENIDLVNTTLRIWNKSNVLVFENTTIITGTLNTTFNQVNFAEGNYNFSIETRGDFNSVNITTNRTFTIHLTAPTLNISEPTGTIDSFVLGDNQTLSWQVSENTQNLTEHITNCSYIYNGVETQVNSSDCLIANTTSFLYVLGVNNLTFTATDNFGIVASNITTWEYSFIEINQTFNNETIEGATESFNINIQTSGTQISTANLVYNNTFNTATFENLGNNTFSITKDLIIPNIPSESNITFFWNIVLSDDSNINSSTNNQTVKTISLDNCSSNTNKIFNLTILDEELQTILTNTTTEIAINIFSSDRSTDVSNISLKSFINPTTICLNINLTSSTNYSLDSVFKYETDDHAIEYYNIDNFNLNQVSSFQNIELFDLNLSDSTEFKITFKDTSFSPVEDALVFINRQYVSEDTFKTVEIPKTDSNSETVGHFVRNDVVYNIIIVKDGEVIGNFENIRVFCDDFTIGDCILPLEAKAGLTIPFEFDEVSGLIYSSEPTFNNETKVMSFTYATTSGATETISMTVERNDVFGNKTLCEDSLTSASGTLSCTVPSTIDDTLLVTKINLGNNTALLTNTPINRSDWGSIGYLAWFLLSLVLVFAFGDDKTNVFMAMLFSYIGAFTIGFIDRTLFSVGAAGTWLIAITIVGIWQLNKGNPQ